MAGRETRVSAGLGDLERPANQANQPNTSDRAWTREVGLVFPQCSLAHVPELTTPAGCIQRGVLAEGTRPSVSWYPDIAMARKNMTLRLPAEQAEELEAVARAEGISVSDAVREAIAEHIARKRKDKAFRERLRAVVERDREILERLAR
jgi:hypothetical protein